MPTQGTTAFTAIQQVPKNDLPTWLVVSTLLKNISQMGLLFPIYGNRKKCSKPPTSFPTIDGQWALKKNRGFKLRCFWWAPEVWKKSRLRMQETPLGAKGGKPVQVYLRAEGIRWIQPLVSTGFGLYSWFLKWAGVATSTYHQVATR